MSDLDLTLWLLRCEILFVSKRPVKDRPCSHPNVLLSAGSILNRLHKTTQQNMLGKV
jgi:hypothetical protein